MNKIRFVFSKTPFFVLIFSVYPSLTFWAWNFREANPGIVLRPIAFSIVISLICLLLCFYFIKDLPKSFLGTSTIVILFFSLGHIANLIENADFYEKFERLTWLINIALPLMALGILIIAFRSIFRLKSDTSEIYTTLNIVATFLLLSSGFSISYNYVKGQSATSDQLALPTHNTGLNNSPDVYYIILDAYARHDSMLSLGYDNSEFISELEDIGFYVATCSRSNYPQTVVSMASSLNMGYLWDDTLPHEGPDDRNAEPVYAGIIHSKARNEFERQGYQILAFDSGAAWLNWQDADKLIEQPPKSIFSSHLNTYEYTFLDTTALHPFLTQPYFLRNKYVYNFDRIHFTLSELPKVAQMAGPKFVYVHMLIPHRPNIFLPDGSMNLNTDYYKLGVGEGITTEYDIEGYINNTKFIDSSLPNVIREIIENSQIPPVIIIQGDHGYQKQDIRFNILNAYYFPDGDYSDLYPSITPINTFRIILNHFFGAEYSILDDQSYNVGVNRPFGKKIAKPYPTECP